MQSLARNLLFLGLVFLLVGISPLAVALPPCQRTEASPSILLLDGISNETMVVTGSTILTGMLQSKSGVDRLDVFVDEKPAISIKNAEMKKLNGSASVDSYKFSLSGYVGFIEEQGKVQLTPGNHTMHLLASGGGGCGQIDLRVEAKEPRIYAIIVGVNQFGEDSALRHLNWAYSDATHFYRYLLDVVHVPQDNLLILTDPLTGKGAAIKPKEDADITGIRKQFEILEKKTKKEKIDTVFFYFSGHGYLDEDNVQYLVPFRGNLDLRASSLLRLSEIEDLLRKTKAERRIFFIDACNSGDSPIEKGLTSADNGMKGDANPDVKSFWKNWTGSFGIVSSTTGESSYETSDPNVKAGVFTYFLLKAFKEADLDDNRLVTLGSAFKYVADKVPDWTQKNLGRKKQQHPQLYGVSGDASKIPIGQRDPVP